MLFAFSTCLGWSPYGGKACEFLFGEKIAKVYQAVFVLAPFGGAVMGENLAWEIADTLNGMMMLPKNKKRTAQRAAGKAIKAVGEAVEHFNGSLMKM